MLEKRLSRRSLLRGVLVTGAGMVLAACAPQVVKETVVVEKEKIVEKPVEKVVKETIIVEGTPKVVEKVVKETVVVEKQAQPASKQVTVRYHCRAGAAPPPSSEFPTHQNRVAEFREEHPEINVIREDIANTDLHDYYVKLATMIAGGTVGDILHGDGQRHTQRGQEGLHPPLRAGPPG